VKSTSRVVKVISKSLVAGVDSINMTCACERV
jgi:hypothetical protein